MHAAPRHCRRLALPATRRRGGERGRSLEGDGRGGGRGHVARASDHVVAGRERALIGPGWRRGGEVGGEVGWRNAIVGSQAEGCC